MSAWRLFLIVGVAALLRFWKLDAKPLWGDEIYTAFYSLGNSLAEVPTNKLLPLDYYWNLLSYPPDSSPWQAAYAVTNYSNHPPLFFMVMNYWLRWWGSSLWSLRSLPALFGVLSVVGGYYLGRSIGGAKVGRYTALLMAVSPYSIYLSQEARHYSLAVAIATFSLIEWRFLLKFYPIKDGKDGPTKTDKLNQLKYRWIAWISLNGLGLWVHYFYVFCIAAQWTVTVFWLWQQRSTADRQRLVRKWLGAMGTTLLLCAPLLLIASSHPQNEGSVSWLSRSIPWWQTILLPWVQSLAAGAFMLVMLPVEASSLWVKILSAISMLGVFWLVIQQGIMGRRSALHLGGDSPLVGYGLCVFTFILALAYGTGKDLTVAPRYFFMLYPAVVAIVASGLAHRRRWVLGIAIAAGVLSQVCIAYNLALFKPYLPEQVGEHLGASSKPTIVLMSAPSPQYQSRILSYVLAIPRRADLSISLTDSVPSQKGQLRISDMDSFFNKSLSLWLVEVDRQTPFPSTASLPNHLCLPKGETLTTTGTKQQQYHCKP